MFGLAAAAGLAAGPSAAREELKLARLPLATDPGEPAGPSPRPIGASDVDRYRQIFALQRDGRWVAADRLRARLKNELLLGHVLAERYLHPTAYRSSYAELAAWLERYADLPQAERIHRLAAGRRPAGAPKPKQPLKVHLEEPDNEQRAREPRPLGSRELWRQGIDSWRKGASATSAERFARLASAEAIASDERAAAAFWAARAKLRARQPHEVVRFLRVAARAGDEFYGLLAQTMLDGSVAFDWHEEEARSATLALTLRYPAVQRAVALAQIGERDLAEGELQRVAARAKRDLAEALTALAVTLELPSVQIQLAKRLRKLDGRRHDGARFPLARWQPAGGYQLDPAFVHAVIRAESGFDPMARSASGAIGLMQVMPGTARLVSKNLKLAYRGERWLMHPPTNMRIGQAWLRHLAGTPAVDNSLIHMVAAYNAGPGRVADWSKDELRHAADDPLLYIESIPITETRTYIKRVLANFWAYQARQGEPIPSLQALAENRWPEVELAGGVLAAARKRERRYARAD